MALLCTEGCSLSWSKVSPVDDSCSLPMGKTVPVDIGCTNYFTKTKPIDPECGLEWTKKRPIDPECDSYWTKKRPIDPECDADWSKARPVDPLCENNWTKAEPVDPLCEVPFSKTVPTDMGCFVEHEPFNPPASICEISYLDLGGRIVIPQEIIFYRTSDDQPINLLQASITADRNSWCWVFEGVVSSRMDANFLRLESGPVECILGINGYYWKIYIEKITDNYQYGSSSYTISGRSKSIELSSPYCPEETNIFASDLTIRQLIDDRINTGGYAWVHTWGDGATLKNWTVPTNTFSYSTKARMDVVQDICKKIGAFVLTEGGTTGDPATIVDRFVFDSLYPHSPHQWDLYTPDEYLSPSHIFSQSFSWEPGMGVDYVYISGVGPNAILRKMYRDAYGPTTAYPTQTNELMVHEDATFQLGRSILDTYEWNKIVHTLTLPLPHADQGIRPALIIPGNLLEVTDLFSTWRSIVASVRIQLNPKVGVSQAIKVEQFQIP